MATPSRRHLGFLVAAVLHTAAHALSPPLCSCPGQPSDLCRPLSRPLPLRDVHAFSDCESPQGPTDPKGCDWRKTINFSAVTTVVDGSKMGGQLVVATDGAVSWRTASIDSSLVCAAHSHGVRVLPIVEISKPVHIPGIPKQPYDFKSLMQNSSAISREAEDLAALTTAAGYDGVNFDWLGMGAPYGNRSTFDYGTPFVALVKQTRAAIRRAHKYGSAFVNIGLNNVSSPVETPVFEAYPLDRLAAVADGLFIMAWDMNHNHAYCALPSSPLPVVSANVKGWIALGVPPSKLILGLPW